MAQKIINTRVDEEKWERFKKIAKLNESDASKEIRKFINKYLADNKELDAEVQRLESEAQDIKTAELKARFELEGK